MVRRPSGDFGSNSLKPEQSQIEPLDKYVDDANRIVVANPVFQAVGNSVICPRSALSMKRLIPIPPQIAQESYCENHLGQSVFTQPRPRADLACPQFIRRNR